MPDTKYTPGIKHFAGFMAQVAGASCFTLCGIHQKDWSSLHSLAVGVLGFAILDTGAILRWRKAGLL